MKKTIIRSSDYEFYRILLPWKTVFSKHRNYIAEELEKRHPRFSGSCCYDARYCLEKKNLMAEIVVMEKASLAQYRNEGGTLCIEENMKRTVFNQQIRIFRSLSLVLLVLTGILSFRIAKSLFLDEKLSSKNSSSESIFSKSESGSEWDSISPESVTLESPEELLPKVFASVGLHGGKISSFSYTSRKGSTAKKSDGLCTFSIHGCNCEEVANAQYCVVSFKNNEPHFEMILPFQKTDAKTEVYKASELNSYAKIVSFENDTKSLASIRSQIRELGALIESEQNSENSVELSFYADFSILYSCLKICGTEADNSFWAVQSFSLSESGNKCRVKISFTKYGENEEFNPVLLTARYAYLFGHELKIVPKKSSLISQKGDAAKALSAKSKVGEIKKNDGSVFVCYRNSEGRMAFLKQEKAYEKR